MVRMTTTCKNCGRRVEWDEDLFALRHVDAMPSGYRPVACMLDPDASVLKTSAQAEDDPVWEVTV